MSARRSPSEPLADRAYAALRDRIVTLRIPPGAPINELALGRELGLGRTPLREALKRLALEQLVTIRPRRGTFASEIDAGDLAAIVDVRSQLEGHAAFRAAQRLTAEQEAELQALAAELAEQRDAAALVELDARVHGFVHRCAANPYLEDTLRRYLDLSRRLWYLVLDRLPQPPAPASGHRRLLDAIADRDPPRAQAAMLGQIATFEVEIGAVL